jgi:predicted Zn-dependent protease
VTIANNAIIYYTDLDKDIKIMEGILAPSVNATTQYWSTQGQTNSSTIYPVVYTKIILHHNKLKNETSQKINRILMHELGHTLGLQHPSLSCNEQALMHQSSRGSIAAYYIMTHDIDNLRTRHGN